MSNDAAFQNSAFQSAAFTQAGTSLAGGLAGAFAARSQGRTAQRFAELNARAAELRAKDAIRRGEVAVSKFRKSSKILKGKQIAALAGQGIDVATGTAAEIQAETERMTTEDVIEIRNNAWREAFGLEFEAISIRGQGSFARSQANQQAFSSLLTGGLQATGAIQSGLRFSADFKNNEAQFTGPKTTHSFR